MTILGLAEAEVAAAVRRVSGGAADALERDAIRERFARAAWSHLAEPGDGVAGHLVQTLGPFPGLELLVADHGANAIAAALRERGVDAETAELAAALDRWRPRLVSRDVLRELSQAERFGVELLVPTDPHWPGLLDDLGPHAPHALWVRGRRGALAALERGVAIVGARAATGYGEHVTAELASGLVDRGYAIVSGAAYGIDGVAHRAALASNGLTVAFLAGGLDRFYPSGHESLLTRIAEQGLIAAEVPCGTAPTRWRFLQRNRLIAAGSLATVVVEAGWRSGSLNTAHHANTLGRPLGVVPGPVTSSASAGCHRILREQPSICVTTADEVAELAPITGTAAPPAEQQGAEEPRDADGTRTRLLDALHASSPRSVEQLAAISGLAPDRVRAELGALDLEGAVRERPTGWVRAAPVRATGSRGG